MPYEVSTPVFEGPCDLLLHLILREEVDLYEISLNVIVDAYLAELDRMQHQSEAFDLEVATEFLLVAATLVELKTKRLLPGPDDLTLDDDLALWEERDLLLARLLASKTFKDAAEALRQLAEVAGRSVPRTVGPEERFLEAAPDLLAGVSPGDLRDAFLRAVAPKPVPRLDLRHLTIVRASVTDAVAELLRTLPGRGTVTFRELTAGQTERLEIVVRLLALLELCKQGMVDLDQVGRFGDIEVRWTGDLSEPDAEYALASIDGGYDG